jgi:CRP-like cAMP-binding protein
VGPRSARAARLAVSTPQRRPRSSAGKPRAATVVAVSDGTLWRISREAFRSALQVR